MVRNGYLPEAEDHHGQWAILSRSKQPRVRDRRPAERRQNVHLEDPAAVPAEDQEHRGADPLAVPQGRQHGRLQRGPGGRCWARRCRGCRPRRSRGSRSVWEDEYEQWNKRSLSKGKQYVYVWADGVHFNIRLEEDRQCILVLMGATPDGKKELIAIADGYRESEQSWKELLLDVKARGLAIDPKLAIGDGALGFWKALQTGLSRTTREQRCWVHKTANVLDKLPKRLQPSGQGDAARDLDGRHARERRPGVRPVRGDVPGEVPQGVRVPGEGPRRAADVLRLPGRALDSPADDQPDRVDVRHGAPDGTKRPKGAARGRPA